MTCILRIRVYQSPQLYQKTLRYRCFPFKNNIFTNTSVRLLLNILKIKVFPFERLWRSQFQLNTHQRVIKWKNHSHRGVVWFLRVVSIYRKIFTDRNGTERKRKVSQHSHLKFYAMWLEKIWVTATTCHPAFTCSK